MQGVTGEVRTPPFPVLIVWGKTQSNWSGNITCTEAFNETPNFCTGDGCDIVSNATSTGFSTSGCSDPITYLAIGKWQ